MPNPPVLASKLRRRDVANLLRSCLTVHDIRACLDEHLHGRNGMTYSIVRGSERAGDFSASLAGGRPIPEIAPEARPVLLEHLRDGDGTLRVVAEPVRLAPGDPPLKATAALMFRKRKYGLFLVHESEDTEDHGPMDIAVWQEVADALGPDLVKAQRHDNASRQAITSLTKFRALHETGELIKFVDLDVLLTKLMELSIGIMGAEVGAIVLREGDEFPCRVDWGLPEEILASLKTPAGGSLLREVSDAGESLLIEDVRASDRVDVSELNVNLDSILIVPLTTHTTPVGLIVIVNSDEGLDPEDSEVLSTIANLSATAVHNALLHQQELEHERISAEMQLAGSLQSALLPSEAPRRPGIELTGWSLPCDETGGDYYDYLDMGDGSTGIVIGDASGHGMGAALTMFIARSSLRALLTRDRDLVEVMATLNDLVDEASELERFMTFFFGLVDAGGRKMTYANAGHDPPILYRPGSDEIREIAGHGIPLSAMPGSRYRQYEAELVPGDFVLFGTDGLWEARNEAGELYGRDRLLDLVRRVHAMPLEGAAEEIRREILEHHGSTPRRDDITAVLMKVV